MATSSAMMDSSSIDSQDLTCTEPVSKLSARSTRYSTLRALRPAARMSSTLSLSTLAGVMLCDRAENLRHTDWADLTEICCPTTERAKVVQALPNCGIRRFMTRSFLTRCLQASCQ